MTGASVSGADCTFTVLDTCVASLFDESVQSYVTVYCPTVLVSTVSPPTVAGLSASQTARL